MKKIVSLLMTLLMLFALTACLVACGDNGDNADNSENEGESADVTYKVTVKNQDGEAISMVVVEFYEGNTRVALRTTNTQGVVTMNKPQGTYTARVTVPQTHEADENEFTLTGEENEIEVTLTEKASEAPEIETVEYTVRVVDQNGNAVAGLNVQLCVPGEGCQAPIATDENGVSVFNVVEDNYSAQITGESEYYAFPSGSREVTIEVTVDEAE